MILICSPPHQFFIVKFFHQRLVGGQEPLIFLAFSKHSIQSSKSPTLSPPCPNPSVYATFSNVM